jgi:hypothetical protein
MAVNLFDVSPLSRKIIPLSLFGDACFQRALYRKSTKVKRPVVFPVIRKGCGFAGTQLREQLKVFSC